jgi:hypothetical protein
MTSLKEKLIKIGAKVVRHGRYIAFQSGHGFLIFDGIQNELEEQAS